MFLYILPLQEVEMCVVQGRAVDIACLNLNNGLDNVYHNILTGKLRKCGMDEWTVSFIENWLNGRSQWDKV